jgi:hypothetical protein
MIGLIADDTKNFMNQLIKTGIFDNFLVLSLDLDTLCRFSVNGAVNSGYMSKEDAQIQSIDEFVAWTYIKPVVATVLRQSLRPTGMKLTLTLSQEATEEILRRHGQSHAGHPIKGFILNILFDGQHVKLTTGVNYNQFTLDKSLEYAFDAMITQFFKKNELVMVKI